MTQQRLTQEVIEVVRQTDDPELRLTQEVMEVVRQAPLADTSVRCTQVYIEVLRQGSPPATRIFPIQQTGRVTNNSGGTRIFPIPIS